MGLSGQALENLHQMMKRGGGKLCNRRYSVNRMTAAIPKKKMGVGMLEQIMTHQNASQFCRYETPAGALITINLHFFRHMVRGSSKQRKKERQNAEAAQEASKSLVQKSKTEISELKKKLGFAARCIGIYIKHKADINPPPCCVANVTLKGPLPVVYCPFWFV